MARGHLSVLSRVLTQSDLWFREIKAEYVIEN